MLDEPRAGEGADVPMMPDAAGGGAADEAHHPMFFVTIEGIEHPWPRNTITTEEIAKLGGWDGSAGVIEIDQHNVERTLRPGEVVELMPGHGFAKKIRFKRG